MIDTAETSVGCCKLIRFEKPLKLGAKLVEISDISNWKRFIV